MENTCAGLHRQLNHLLQHQKQTTNKQTKQNKTIQNRIKQTNIQKPQVDSKHMPFIKDNCINYTYLLPLDWKAVSWELLEIQVKNLTWQTFCVFFFGEGETIKHYGQDKITKWLSQFKPIKCLVWKIIICNYTIYLHRVWKFKANCPL